jgi:hypothetical protein
MAELRAAIRKLRGTLSGPGLAEAIVEGFEAIDKRLTDIEKRLPTIESVQVGDTQPSAGTAIHDSKG